MKKMKLDQYFLAEVCPYTHKRKLKTKNLKVLAIVSVVSLVLGVLFLGDSSGGPSPPLNALGVETIVENSSATKSNEGSIQVGSGSLQAGQFGGGGSGRSGIPRVDRQYTASQLVQSAGNSHAGFALPMGSTFPAVVVNTLLSSDANQPVIAQINEAVYWKNSVYIPEGTRAIGSATFDDASRRLQIRFQNLVYPGGDQHSISALALLPDGSSGIPGKYYSRAFAKRAGSFVGTFFGGLADGVKDKQQASGPMGGSFEPGSLKNGLLNGLSLSTLEQSKQMAEEAQEVKGYLEVPGGSEFLMYLEKEYQP